MENETINRLLAEKVMGYEWAKNPYYANTDDYGWLYELGWKKKFNPSENIEDAWAVVNKLCYEQVETSFKMELFFMGYWGTFEVHEKTYFSGQQNNAPKAICISALKTIGVEI